MAPRGEWGRKGRGSGLVGVCGFVALFERGPGTGWGHVTAPGISWAEVLAFGLQFTAWL